MSADPVVGTITVTQHDDHGTWLIDLNGEHDISTTPQLDRQTSSIWPLCTTAIVDLSDAAFIDCAVINWLLHTARALDASGHRALRVVEGPPGCLARRLLEILGVRDVIACYATRLDALAEQPQPVPAAGCGLSSERRRRIADERPALRLFASSAS